MDLLLSTCRMRHRYLYVILDVFSRFVTGWMVATRERGELAKRPIRDSCTKQGILPGHQDPYPSSCLR
jgi:putative transposase